MRHYFVNSIVTNPFWLASSFRSYLTLSVIIFPFRRQGMINEMLLTLLATTPSGITFILQVNTDVRKSWTAERWRGVSVTAISFVSFAASVVF